MRAALLLSTCAVLLGSAASAYADDTVDLALVLAVDTSASIKDESFRLQMDGYASAFLDPAVIATIAKSGGHGVAVTMVEWSGTGQQMQVIPWTIIRDKATSENLAASIKIAKRVFRDITSISEGIDFSVALLHGSGLSSSQRVIDVSGDGPNNAGRDVRLARDAAVKDGITINGLPILTDEFDLKTYYKDNVSGGVGSFIEVADGMAAFAETIRYKIVKEISDAQTPGPAQAQPGTIVPSTRHPTGRKTHVSAPGSLAKNFVSPSR